MRQRELLAEQRREFDAAFEERDSAIALMGAPVTLRERAELATAVRVAKAAERAQALFAELERGECLKRAAARAGVSYRTAKRYKARAA